MALLPGDIKLDQGLTEQLDPVAKLAKGRLASSLGAIRGRYQADATVAPKAPGGYFDQTMGMAADRGNRNIDNGLYSALGGGAYKDFQDVRANNQQLELAKQYRDMMKPSSLDEVLGGLSTAGGIGAAGYGIYKGMPKKTPYADMGQPLSLYDQNNPETGLSYYLGRK